MFGTSRWPSQYLGERDSLWRVEGRSLHEEVKHLDYSARVNKKVDNRICTISPSRQLCVAYANI
jgi:hypothetical protein